MSELNAFTLESEEGARALESDLKTAQEAQELKVGDAALVVRMANGKPEFSHAVNLVDRVSMAGILWGFILALVFWTRWWGVNIGRTLGDLRLDDDFVKEVVEGVGRGHSALLAFVEKKMVAGIPEVVGSRKPKIYQAIFSAEHEKVLKTVFQATRENI